MRKKYLFVFILFLFISQYLPGEPPLSLSHIFLQGKGITDQDSDQIPDDISLNIIIPDNPNAYEICVAGDLAARANFESLAVDFSIIKKESDMKPRRNIPYPILIGNRLRWTKKIIKNRNINFQKLQSNQGIVSVFSDNNQNGIVLLAGSRNALLLTGRAFFLRWPYLWDIWGRKEGDTYTSVEKDIGDFFKNEKTEFKNIIIKSAIYEFINISGHKNFPKKLKFHTGEIKNLIISIQFKNENEQEKAFKSLRSLQLDHKRGIRTNLLSFAGCARLSFELLFESKIKKITIDRMGYPQRMLTPSYKSASMPQDSGKNFDLLELFSNKGFYSDKNDDRIPDSIDACIILPEETNIKGPEYLASRMVMETAGASFPLLYLDKEIKNKESLVSPVLIGKDNSLNQSLVKTGKLTIPDLDQNQCMVRIIPHAFNKSNALSLISSDNLGVEKALSYLSQIYPYFGSYKMGNPQFQDVPVDIKGFLKGEKGSAESYFYKKLKNFLKEIEFKELEYFRMDIILPKKNYCYGKYLKNFLKETLDADKIEVKNSSLKESKLIFEEEKAFQWETNNALELIKEQIKPMQNSEERISISLGISESPEVRNQIKKQIKDILEQKNIFEYDIEILSSYKQGFFWLIEKILPSIQSEKIDHLLIKFPRQKDPLNQPKRFYAEPYRWLKELYPVDEIISEETHIPLEKIVFEMKEDNKISYEVLAYDNNNNIIFQDEFYPHTRERTYLNVLPEWGKTTVTTNWLKIKQGNKIILDTLLKSDLEGFWEYYQKEILTRVHSYILKKTKNKPTFSKQPYFKRLLVEMWFSEPDYKLNLDEEIISSLEAIHDEIYFDTLDFLRGITSIERKKTNIPDDTSRYSAPGNIFPLIHPSSEGEPGRIKIKFEGWKSKSPQINIKWKEKGRQELTHTIVFPSIKAKSIKIPSLIYNGSKDIIESLYAKIELNQKEDYLNLIDIIDNYRKLKNLEIIPCSFDYPQLKSIIWGIEWNDLKKDEIFDTSSAKEILDKNIKTDADNGDIVPTDKILSHQMCMEIVQKLSSFDVIHSYNAGISYEERKVPVIESFLPNKKYVSIPRLVTFKPTLYLNGRQHANEVSSTNYILKFAELLARKDEFKNYLNKINFIFHPMENPDGADLAYQLQKITPHHSLHAGRYSPLGIEIGYLINSPDPILPEAKVRKEIFEKWLPDIHLNLHGYPSHEWVQQFSNYSPYLFRDYWIPRGWFAYYRALSLPIYEKWTKAGIQLKKFIIKEMNASDKISSSNRIFYNRYFRWAARWQPHINYLEIYDGLNLYSKRHSSRERKLSPSRRITYISEVPELMDETAHGEWLNFLCQQGLSYIKAHAKYLSHTKFETARIEEELKNRIHIQFIRSRPGNLEEDEQ
ncbi:MAG: M14 family metallopeptidase [Candidatus Aminicenantaceae bacterium]